MISISVIIPTCDRPPAFLRTAVDSVLKQNLQANEIIVVDNGVCDADLSSMPKWVKHYRLPPRVGPSRARNFGAAMARGTHLAFLDDDDWWDIDFLSEASVALHAAGASCVYGRKDIHSGTETKKYKCPTPETLSVATLLKRNPGTGGQNILIEKALFWKVAGFDETLRTSEDKALALELLLYNEVIAIAPKAAAVVRSHDGDRARHAILYKLRFAWKYRRLLGVTGLLQEVFRVSIRQARHRSSRLLWRRSIN
ncbi:MAG: glycosyltransferase [Rhodobacteraceae bacterium]|nr:MAG: glycosyltransferase [Paracoccaceae bacterium]